MSQHEKTQLGWIGTGVMGHAMCQRLMKAGYSISIHTRTPERAKLLLEAGAHWAESPKQVAAEAQTIVTMVGFPQDVAEVYLGSEGIAQAIKPDTLAIDMTTTKPSLAVEIGAVLNQKGAHFIDAPVSGGDVGARYGTLSIMAGGSETAMSRAMPLFEVLGKNIVHQGDVGTGQHTKMCNQIAIAGTMIGVCESLLYGRKAGLDLERMLESIGKGAAGCWTLDHLAPRILKRNFDPGFYIDHFIKDMGIALEEAAKLDLALPGLALVHQLYRAVKAQGHGKCGTQALILGLETLAGIG